jgi:hypothetical protein
MPTRYFIGSTRRVKRGTTPDRVLGPAIGTVVNRRSRPNCRRGDFGWYLRGSVAWCSVAGGRGGAKLWRVRLRAASSATAGGGGGGRSAVRSRSVGTAEAAAARRKGHRPT